jgi:hypothetical protein
MAEDIEDMTIITQDQFLQWASANGLHIDPRYPQSAVLQFRAGSDARFWKIPPEPERRPYFLASLLDLMRDWKTCYVWRHLGTWPDPAHVNSQRVNDVVELLILKGLGLPLGGSAVVECQSLGARGTGNAAFLHDGFWMVGQ